MDSDQFELINEDCIAKAEIQLDDSNEIHCFPDSKFALKDILIIRAIHLYLSIDQPKETHGIPSFIQKQLLEAILT